VLAPVADACRDHGIELDSRIHRVSALLCDKAHHGGGEAAYTALEVAQSLGLCGPDRLDGDPRGATRLKMMVGRDVKRLCEMGLMDRVRRGWPGECSRVIILFDLGPCQDG